MNCYKDRTFCPKEANCGNEKCERNYVHCKDAGNIPVMFFVHCPIDCTEYVPVKEKGE